MRCMILCYDNQREIVAWSTKRDDQVMAQLTAVNDKLAAQGRLGPELAAASGSAGAFEIRPITYYR